MPEPTVVIGTAGHIDHGKTSLLRAVTGIDADRLPEERARGMTIDVGYAHLAFDDGVELDFVDVPGHDRLIGNMLVGAGEIDAAMLVVAADDGPRPQTLEHLQLLDALGIGEGLAVVTKTDAVAAGRAEAVLREVAALLAGTSLAGAPVLAASAVSGEGIGELRIALRGLRDRVAGAGGERGASRGPLRLAVDRAFAVKGRGVVVTGSLRGGSLAAGASIRREPGGDALRVREVQVHGLPRAGHDGGRTAVNVAGLAADQLRRGDVLTSGEGVAGTSRILVALLPAAAGGGLGGDIRAGVAGGPEGGGRRLRASAVLRLHIGTDQVDAAMRRLAARPSSFAILTLERDVATFVGDRGVLREPASGRVVAGVRVLDLAPPRGASRRRITEARLDPLVAAAVREPGANRTTGAALLELHGARVAADSTPRQLDLASDVRVALEQAALDAIATHHRESPISPGLQLPRARAALLRRLRSLATLERRDIGAATAAVGGLIDSLVGEGRLARTGDSLHDPARGTGLPQPLLEAMDRLERALDVPAPPSLEDAAAAAGCPPEGVRALQASGRIIRLGPDMAWSTAMYHRLAALALDRARVAPLTPAAFRDATGTSRKYVLTILEDLDGRGILRRTPEGHIPGPRAPRATTPA